jgi:hypothetical protein
MPNAVTIRSVTSKRRCFALFLEFGMKSVPSEGTLTKMHVCKCNYPSACDVV